MGETLALVPASRTWVMKFCILFGGVPFLVHSLVRPNIIYDGRRVSMRQEQGL